MMISKLIIKNFGKFTNKEIELKPGINLIYGNNESGKSTIHKFIEGILYGFFKPYVKRKSYSSDYEKYKPWNGESYEGAITINSEGREYWIYRKFNKYDEEVKVIDKVTGEDISNQCNYDKRIKLISPTSQIWNISHNLYNNVLSVGQLKTKPDERDNDIKESLLKINNTSDISITNVINDLCKQKEEIGTPKRSKSEYGKLSNKLKELNEEKKVAMLISEELKSDYNLLRKYNEEKIEVEKDLGRITEELKIAEKNKNNKELYKLETLKDNISTLKIKISEYAYFENLTIEDIDNALKLYREYEDLTKEFNDIEEYLQKNKKNPKSNRIFINIMSIIEIIFLLSAFFINPILLIGVILNFIILIYLINRNSKNNAIITAKERLVKIKDKLNLVDEERTTLKIWINSEEEYNKLRNSIVEYTFLSKSLQEKTNEYNRLNTIKDVITIDTYNINELKEQSEILYNKRLKIEKNISRLEERINFHMKSTRSIQDIIEEISRLEDKLLKLDKEMNAIDITIDIIEKVANSQQRNYSSELSKIVSNTISNVTDTKYDDVKIDKNLEISVLDKINNKFVTINELSEGTKDQLYIALRMALANVLGKGYPLIFDDSFIQFDDIRLEKMLKLISQTNLQKQIIILSCQQREKNILDKLDVEYTYIKL